MERAAVAVAFEPPKIAAISEGGAAAGGRQGIDAGAGSVEDMQRGIGLRRWRSTQMRQGWHEAVRQRRAGERNPHNAAGDVEPMLDRAGLRLGRQRALPHAGEERRLFGFAVLRQV